MAAQMTGSEKQVAWSEQIRTKRIAQWERRAAEIEANQAKLVEPFPFQLALASGLRQAAASTDNQTSAAWWIDRRNDNENKVAAELVGVRWDGARAHWGCDTTPCKFCQKLAQ